MSENTYTVPASLFDRFTAWLDGAINKPTPEPEPQKQAEPDTYAAQLQAAQAERDNYAARVAELEAAQAQKARVDHFASQLNETPLNDNSEMHTLLAGLTDEQAAPIVQQFKALAAQINESQLTGKIGNSHASNDNPVAAFDAAIQAKMKEAGVDYNAALIAVSAQHPQLFTAYQAAQRGGK